MNDPKSSLKEIARLAGVSIGTVHRTIYGKPGVGDDTRKRILRIVNEVGYQVDEVASAMKRGEMTVQVVLPSPTREDRFYFRGIWKGIRDAAKKLERYRINFAFCESKHRLDKMHLALSEIYDANVQSIHGLVTIADTAEADAWVSRFSKRGVPVILLSSCEKDAECVASIKVDHHACGQLAADFFSYALPKRKGKILFLSGQSDSYSNRLYADGFRQRIADEIPASDLIQLEGLGKSSILGKAKDALQKEKLRGIFALNARNTMTLCELLADRPDAKDILFVGSDVFDELAPYFENGTLDASIYQFNREQGERAVTLIHEYLLTNTVPPNSQLMPTLLALRSNYHFFTS